jgi:3-oxoacyl-[acyl-carrier protein] reductase
MDFKDKVAIVTGSATGLGAATAIKLGSLGGKVVINYTKSEVEAKETAAEVEKAGGKALLCRADVANDADCRRMAQTALDSWGRIDALVNNAGSTKFVAHGDLEGLSAEDFQRIYAINVVGAFQMARACTPAMRKAGRGAIVNVSSIAGVSGIGSSVAYAASKGALNTMTLSLARVLGPEISVNAICPGFIQGKWLRQGLGAATYDAYKSQLESTTPLQKTCTPQELADVVAFLILGTGLITGETIMVDGGHHLQFTPLAAR